jgi:GNAT superfamily N-acetyltransferase
MTVRRAAREDIPLIRSMADVAFRDTYRDILSPDQMDYMLDWMYSETSLERQMGSDGHIYFIAESDEGEPFSYFSVQPLGRQEDDAYLFEFQKLYLLPEWRGKGLGGKLFNYVLQFAKDAAEGQPCRIQLHVNRYNSRAVAMYRHYGMEVLVEADFPIGKGYYMNDYVMGKAF